MKEIIYNHIKDLWDGKVKLYIIFWIYTILIGDLLRTVFIEKYHTISDTYAFIIFILFYIYSIFINKALWSSAVNYQGWHIWTKLVKLCVVLDIIWLFYLLPMQLFYPEDFKDLLILVG